MVCKGYDDVMELADRELVELKDVRGTTLRVTQGMLWVTQDQDVRAAKWLAERHLAPPHRPRRRSRNSLPLLEQQVTDAVLSGNRTKT